MQLDRTKPFATVHGDLTGIKFEQGGHYFDNMGNEISAAMEKSRAAENAMFKAQAEEKEKEVREKLMAELGSDAMHKIRAEAEAKLRAEIEAKVRAELTGGTGASSGDAAAAAAAAAARVRGR